MKIAGPVTTNHRSSSKPSNDFLVLKNSKNYISKMPYKIRNQAKWGKEKQVNKKDKKSKKKYSKNSSLSKHFSLQSIHKA